MAKDNSGIIALGAIGVGVALLVFSSRSQSSSETVKIPVPNVPPPKETGPVPVTTKPPYVPGTNNGWYLVDPNTIEPVPAETLNSKLSPGDKVTYAIGDDPDGQKATVLCQVLATVVSGPHPVSGETVPTYVLKIEFAKVVQGDPNNAPTQLPLPGTQVKQFRNRLVSLGGIFA